MADIELIIKIDEDLYEMCRDSLGDEDNIEGIIANGTPLNGTNGEVLMEMFPPSVYFPSNGTYTALLTKDCIVLCSNTDWWNAPYKTEGEEV